MVEAGTLCGNADVEKFSGANASATADVEAYTNVYIKEAEGLVCLYGKYDYVTNYASCSTIGKEFLRLLTASLAAIMVIQYDMKAYVSLAEAQSMMQGLSNNAIDMLNIIKDKDSKNFILQGNTT